MGFNSTKTAIASAFSKIKAIKPSMSGVIAIPRWHAVAGVIAEQPGQNVIFMTGSEDVTKGPTKLRIDSLANAIQQLYVDSDHGQVKNNIAWRSMYQVGVRNVHRMNTAGVVVQHSLETVPCHNCGVITPYGGIQVDHHMPQVDGNFVLKTFRALGLTVAGPTGSKGSALASGNLGTLVMHPKGRAPGDYGHLVNSTAANKWTTNDEGSVLLSLFKLADGYADLERFCKNSLLNLVPLCRACNGEKSDWVKPIK